MTVTHEYRPFPKPECTTTHEEMVAKLAVRVGVPSAPSAPDEPLKWVKGSDAWTILSRCGLYKIRKRCVDPSTARTGAQFTFEAFRVVKDHWDFSLGIRADPAEARKLCQQNREAHP
jgi:hypothetical protein